MNILMWVHIASGLVALPAGAIALSVGKGGRLHRLAGTWFLVSMLVLGVTASPLAWLKEEPDLGIGGIFTCYFVLTSWVTARRRDGATGRFEMIACAVAFGTAAVVALGAVVGDATTPAGRAPLFVLSALCLIAGLGDLRASLRKSMTRTQRLSRHLWRMCFAFFIATGSFFLGQQDVLPDVVRGSPLLFVLAFAPLAIMLYWLVRLLVSARKTLAADEARRSAQRQIAAA